MGKYLPDTIESILANLRPGDEYFIVDGGSTDDSISVIRHYEDRLAGWISEPDRGYADAIAKGFERASGDYLCWINCGDLLLAGALDKAGEVLCATAADMIFGDDVYVDESGRILQATSGYAANLRDMMLYGGWTPLQDACYWRRHTYQEIGGIDPCQRYAADFDLFLRMCMKGRCVYVPAIFSAFRRHDGQTSAVHASEYRNERERCRQRELRHHSPKPIQRILLSAYYWLKVRWRARMQSKNHRMWRVTGKSVSSLVCQDFEPR